MFISGGDMCTENIFASSATEAWKIFEASHPGIHPISGPKKET